MDAADDRVTDDPSAVDEGFDRRVWRAVSVDLPEDVMEAIQRGTNLTDENDIGAQFEAGERILRSLQEYESPSGLNGMGRHWSEKRRVSEVVFGNNPAKPVILLQGQVRESDADTSTEAEAARGWAKSSDRAGRGGGDEYEWTMGPDGTVRLEAIWLLTGWNERRNLLREPIDVPLRTPAQEQGEAEFRDIPVSEAEGYLVESALDEDRVEELQRQMEQAGGFVGEPLLIEDTPKGPLLTDGRHRLEAAKRAGIDEVPTEWYDSSTREGRFAALERLLEAERRKEDAPQGAPPARGAAPSGEPGGAAPAADIGALNVRDDRENPSAEGSAVVPDAVGALSPGARSAFDAMAERTNLTVVATSQSVAEAQEWANLDDAEWQRGRGSSNVDDRTASQVPGLFNINGGQDASIVVAVDAPDAQHTAQHEMSHAVDRELGYRMTGEWESFSAMDEFAQFYQRVLDAYDGTGLIKNPAYANTSLLAPYLLHMSSGQKNHNGTFGRGEFFAEAYASSMEAAARIRDGEDRDTVLLELGASLGINPIREGNIGPAGDKMRSAGGQILDYFTDLDDRIQRGAIGPGGEAAGDADQRRTITTGRRAATTKIRKNDLGNPDSTHAELLDGEEKSALSRALKEFYGIEPLQMTRNIVEAFGMATKGEREFGSRWYADAFDYAKGLRDRFRSDGMTLEKSAAVIAALSPQTRWGANKLLAERVMQVLSENASLDDALLDRRLQYAGKKPGTTRTQTLREALEENRADNKGTGAQGEFGQGKRLFDLEDDQLYEIASLLVRDEGLGDFQYDNPDTEGRSVGKVYMAAAPMKDNFNAALAVWRAEPGDLQAVSSGLGGHKVRSFYNNIIHDPASGEPDRSITIDTHALDTAILGALATRLGLKASPKPTKRANKNMKQHGLEFPEGGWFDANDFLNLSAMDGVKFSDVDKARKGTYVMFHEAFRRATEDINAQLGTDYTPKQVQAIVWLTTLDDAVAVEDQDLVDDYVDRWNKGMSNVRSAKDIDPKEYKRRTNAKSVPRGPLKPIGADEVWLAPTDSDTGPNPFEGGGGGAPDPDVPWNDFTGLEDNASEWATNYMGTQLEPMPEPGTPEFEELAAQIREVHPDAQLPTKTHQAAFLHPDWRSRDVQLLWRGYSRRGARAKGYSPRNQKRNLFQRFARVQDIAKETPRVRTELVSRAEQGDEVALAALLILDTGMRVGSGKGGKGRSKVKGTKDTYVDTYAATSLESRHLQQRKDGTLYWRFSGKGNITNTYDVTEPILKQKMSEWYTGGSGTGRIWSDAVNDRTTSALLAELYKLDVKNHDMRRQHATLMAMRLIDERKTMPKSPAAFKKARAGVVAKVASAINDTPSVAMNNYIDWGVWADWEESAGLVPTMLKELEDLEDGGVGESADTVIASARESTYATPGLDVDGPAFQRFLDYYSNAFMTVENPEISGPWLAVPDDDEEDEG